jgi:quercetin dioxygenase-like cupin family protein
VIVASIDELELSDTTSSEDDSLRTRTAYPISWERGASSSAVVYFELEPGDHLGVHSHSAEELLYVVAGEVEATVEDETERLGQGSLAVAPARVKHDVRCVGEGTARCIGFFPSASVQSVYERELDPDGERVQGTPLPPID